MTHHFSFCKIMAASVLALAMSVIALAQAPLAKPASGDTKPFIAQDGKPPDRPEEVLTDAQRAKIKSVLAPYKAASLTADDAKLIKRTLREAGIRRSRKMKPPARPPRDGNDSGTPAKPSTGNAPK